MTDHADKLASSVGELIRSNMTGDDLRNALYNRYMTYQREANALEPAPPKLEVCVGTWETRDHRKAHVLGRRTEYNNRNLFVGYIEGGPVCTWAVDGGYEGLQPMSDDRDLRVLMAESAKGWSSVHVTFADLRSVNEKRLPLFKGNSGLPAHSEPDGSDWSINDWIVAATGELGELANLAKKLHRGDFEGGQRVPEDVAKKEAVSTYAAWMRSEVADVAIYLDILHKQLCALDGCSHDLGADIRHKFNVTSAKIGVDVTL